MIRTALLPVVATAGLLAAAPTAANASFDNTTLDLVATATSNVNQPHGFSFTDVIRNARGIKVGDDLGSCVFNQAFTKAYCHVTFTLDRGTILARFVTVQHQTTFQGDITGGTGRYEGITGLFTAVGHGKRTNITLHFHR